MKAPPAAADPAALHSAWCEAMLAGDFERAWRETDRLELPRRERERRGEFAWQPHHLLWNGAPFSGRDVLVRCDHGLTDAESRPRDHG